MWVDACRYKRWLIAGASIVVARSSSSATNRRPDPPDRIVLVTCSVLQ
jgi:hypothetical protein